MWGKTGRDRTLHEILFERQHDKETPKLKVTNSPYTHYVLSNKFDDDNDDHDDDV
jgi:hypothetical protein